MFEIRPFQPDDVMRIDAREPDRSIAAGLPDLLALAKLQVTLGPAFTGFLNDTPIACAGLNIVWSGVAEGWVFSGKLVNSYPLFFHRSIARELNRLIVAHKLHRVQVHIPESHVVSCRWIQRLGFHFEAALPKYGQNSETYLCYSRIT